MLKKQGSANGYQDHPLASLLPMMGTMDLNELGGDIAQNGLREKITLFEGQILDGRNRYRACGQVGVAPEFYEFTGNDPLAFIVSVNVKRRHLTTAQRQLIAGKLANMPRGDISRFSRDSSQTAKLQNGKTVAQVARELDVSPRGVETAKEVLRNAPPEEIRKIERGEKTVTKVAREIKQAAKLKPATAKTEKVVTLDRTGYPIPESILAEWQRADVWSKKILASVSDARSQLKSALDTQDFILAEVTNSTVADLNNAYTSLKCVTPYAVCTTCQGRQRAKCNLCKSRGWISEFMYRQVVPEETKKLREMGRKK